MSPEPPLWQYLGQHTYGRLERSPVSGRLELTVSDLDDRELTLVLDVDGARSLALALLEATP